MGGRGAGEDNPRPEVVEVATEKRKGGRPKGPSYEAVEFKSFEIPYEGQHRNS